MNQYSLLIVENDNDLRQILIEQLQIHKEFKVFQEQTAEAGSPQHKKKILILPFLIPNSPILKAIKPLKNCVSKDSMLPLS